jgi:hypothetical protein
MLSQISSRGHLSKPAIRAGILGASIFIGTAIQPAHAQGTFSFDNGASDFFNQVNLADPNDSFQVNFSPENTLNVSNSTGIYNPIFPGTPPPAAFPTTATGPITFSRPGSVNANFYLNQQDITLFFDGASDDVTIVIPAGREFSVLSSPNSYTFQLQGIPPGGPIDLTLASGTPQELLGGQFSFGTTTDGEDESASFQGSVASNRPVSRVPGPLPLMGAGMAFGFSRKLRSRIKSKYTLQA